MCSSTTTKAAPGTRYTRREGETFHLDKEGYLYHEDCDGGMVGVASVSMAAGTCKACGLAITDETQPLFSLWKFAEDLRVGVAGRLRDLDELRHSHKISENKALRERRQILQRAKSLWEDWRRRVQREEAQRAVGSLPEAPSSPTENPVEPDANETARVNCQSIRPKATESAEDPQATLIQHKASDLIKAEFLWNPYLLADEFCTIAGPKGAGKSWMAMDIGTRVTTGSGFPGDETEKAARSIVYGTREGRTQGEAVLGRFVRLGADLNLVHFLPRAWGLDDLPGLEAKILRSKAALVILDPLQSFFPGSSAYAGPRARQISEALSDLANQTHCCILGILHLTKNHKHARGSGEIENVARVNLQVGQSGLDGRPLLVQTKNSEAPAGVSRHYAIYQNGTGIDWQDEAPDEGLDELTRSPKERPRELATVFLRTVLADGPMRSKEVLVRAESLKLNEKTVRRAASVLGISQARGTLFQHGGEWWWKLPGTAPKLGVHLSI